MNNEKPLGPLKVPPSTLPDIPRNLVVVVATHGCTVVYSEDVETFKVPEGMTLTLVSATLPGVVNVTQSDQVNAIVASATEDPTSITSTLKRTDRKLMDGINSQLKNGTGNVDMFKEYIQSRLKNPEPVVLKPGNEVAEKIFSRGTYEGLYQAFDYRINAINIPGTPDLFDLLRNRTSGPSTNTRYQAWRDEPTIKFSLLLEILALEKVTNLTLYDLSCSSFQHEDPMYMTLRDERRVRMRESRRRALQRQAIDDDAEAAEAAKNPNTDLGKRKRGAASRNTRRRNTSGGKKTRRVRGKTNTHRTRRRKLYNGYTKNRSRTVRRH